MDERWELSRGPRSISLYDRHDGMVGIQLEDPSEIAFVKFTPDEACRIALELLRRSKVIPASVLHLVDGCLPPAPASTG